ncbi:hypothetical protein LXL04_024412 [Taraxacum kok-saghyz]
MLSQLFTAGDHLPSDVPGFFETGGFTPWDNTQETQFLFSPQEPVFSFSSSDNSTPKITSSGEGNVMDERKKRRMISNRESARRSRMRKQKHLENLRNQLNRLKTNNREVANRLRVVNLHGKLVREENRRLRSESMMLQQKLSDIRRQLLLRRRQLHHQLLPSAWPCHNNVTSIYEQYPPSLIT